MKEVVRQYIEIWAKAKALAKLDLRLLERQALVTIEFDQPGQELILKPIALKNLEVYGAVMTLLRTMNLRGIS